jgi:uncharacterized phage protein (TIGR02218 family)
MFGLLERSRQKAKPITLYRVQYGDLAGATVLMTDCETPVTKDGETYIPISIMRDTIVASGTLDKAMLAITVPRNAQAAELFRVDPPTFPTQLTIFQGHVGDSDWKTIWFGAMKSVTYEGSKAKLNCEPLSMRLMQPGLRRHYQITCPHVLYGPRCNVAKGPFLRTAVVTAITKQTITLADGWNGALDTSKYLNGYVQWPGGTQTFDARAVIGVIDAHNLKLAGIPTGVVVGQSISILPGCNHQMSDCLGVYANIQNYGGCRFIPVKNPTGLSSLIGSG